MLEGLHEPALLINEMEHAADIYLPQAIIKGMVHGSTLRGYWSVQCTRWPRRLIWKCSFSPVAMR